MAEKRNTATRGNIKRAFTELMAEKGLDALSISDIARRAGINRGTVYLHFTDKYDLMRQLEDDALARLGELIFPASETQGDSGNGAGVKAGDGPDEARAGADGRAVEEKAPAPESKRGEASAGDCADGRSAPPASEEPDKFVSDTAILRGLRSIQEDRAFFTALVGPGGDAQFAEKFKQVMGERLLAEVQRSDTLTVNTHGIPAEYAREIALGSIMAVVLLWLKKGAEEPCELIASMIGKAKRLSPYDLLG